MSRKRLKRLLQACPWCGKDDLHGNPFAIAIHFYSHMAEHGAWRRAGQTHGYMGVTDIQHKKPLICVCDTPLPTWTDIGNHFGRMSEDELAHHRALIWVRSCHAKA